jgi:hypothetical protein
MSDFDALDRKLHQAAEEVRQAARTMTPPPLPGARTRTAPARGWLAFAGAFAVVALAVGVLPGLLRGTATGPTIPVGSGGTTTVPTTEPSVSAPVAQCSATGVPRPREQEGLPEAVAETRRQIIEAAMACDLEALDAISPEFFITHFGGGRFDELVRWEEEGDGKLGLLLQILDLSYGVQENEDHTWYVWPAAFAYDSWDEIPQEHVDELTAIMSDDLIAEMRDGWGAYAYWRTGIRSDGIWHFFVAGD